MAFVSITGGTLFVSTNKCHLQFFMLKGILLLLFTVMQAVQTTDEGCLRVMLNSPERLIRSAPYLQHRTCQQWFIKGNGSEVITISIHDLNIGSSIGLCNDSYLSIGPTPERYYCGSLLNNIPKVYVSNRSSIWIKFVANRPDCSFSLNYVKGEVPPDHCLGYKCTNGKCIMSGWRCNGADECGDNSDEMHCPTPSTPEVLSTTMGPYDCGPHKFPCIDPITNMFVCLHNYLKCNREKDCQAAVDELDCDTDTCGGTFRNASGSFSTPSYPLAYRQDSQCEWFIQVAQNDQVQLRFKDFDLYSEDYVAIYDGNDYKDPLLGRFYGYERPSQVIESTQNKVYVVFVAHQHPYSDGHVPIGFNITFQTKGDCLPHQLPCSYGEKNCYNKEDACDTIWHCILHGGDERDCGHCHRSKMFQCDMHGTQCYSEEEHCNGIGQCSNRRDEENCTPAQCGPHNGTFLCANNRCIYDSWRCDGTNDCDDHSDEADCSQPSTKVITAAVIGSLICGLLLVIALGCTCKLYALRLQEHQRILQQSAPINRLQESIYARRMAPPPYLEAMATSRPYDELPREPQLIQGAPSSGRRGRRGSRRNRQGSHDSGGRGVSDPSQSRTAEDGDVALIDITMSDTEGQFDTPLLIPPNESSSEEEDVEEESNCAQIETSNVSISVAAGISAQWRRNPQKLHRSSSQISQHSTSDLDNINSRADVASLDSACASHDCVVIALNEESPKVSSTDLSRTEHSNPSATTHEIGTGQSNEDSEVVYSASDHQGSDGEDSVLSSEVQDDTQPLIS